ncbi:Potassium channel [Cryptotrichosporon argae]
MIGGADEMRGIAEKEQRRDDDDEDEQRRQESDAGHQDGLPSASHGEEQPDRQGEKKKTGGRNETEDGQGGQDKQAHVRRSDHEASGDTSRDQHDQGDPATAAHPSPARRALRRALDEIWPNELRHAHPVAKYCPLIAAIAAPFATLMDIPALTQHWYSYNGVEQKDPTVNLVLSSVELALSFIANALLVVRFSSQTPFWWRTGTRLSLVLWIIKTLVALVNLIVFGATTRNGNGYTYDEAFWCAVVSLIVSGMITFVLIFHYIFAFGRPAIDRKDVRQEGRKFMLSVTAFMVLLAIQSLVFCKIESWAYLDAIYFSVQTALTIGYGDFTPTTTAGKVLIFPFAVLTISQLGNEISLIIGFIAGRADARRDKWRKRYEGAMHREANKVRPHASLTEEMALVHQINKREETMSQVYDLMWSALSLIVFWVIGATLFSEIEGWTYGNAVYAVVILSTTIGFGDYTPTTPAGRVVWIVYALMAVPIVTSFAVQTVTGINRFDRQRFREERSRDPDAFAPHAQFVQDYHRSYRQIRERLVGPRDDHWLPAGEGSRGDGDEDGGDGGGGDASGRQGKHGSEQEKKGAAGAGSREEAQEALDEQDKAQREEDARRWREREASDDDAGASDKTEVDGSLRRSSKLPSKRSHTSDDSGDDVDDGDAEGDATPRGRPERPGRLSDDSGSPVRWDDAGEGAEGAQLDAGEKFTENQPAERKPAARMNRHFDEQDEKIRHDAGRVRREEARGDGQDAKAADDEGEGESEGEGEGDEGGEGERRGQRTGQTKKERDLERDLLGQLINRVVQLEAEARQMMLDSMDKGLARTLLLADRNIQIRDVRALRGDDANLAAIWRGEEDQRNKDAADRDRAHEGDDDAEDMLARVRRYRNTFAEILVLSSILQKLEGDDLNQFERWRQAEGTVSIAEGQEQSARHERQGKMRRPRGRCRHRDEEECDCGGRDRDRDRERATMGKGKALMLRLTRSEGDRQRANEPADSADPDAGDPGDAGETLDELADERYAGVTGRLFKHHVRKIRADKLV